MPYMKKFENTLYSKSWITYRYVTLKWSSTKIAEKIGCDPSAVLRSLRRFSVPIRTHSEAQKLAPHPGSHAPRPKKGKDTLHRSEWLRKKYIDEGLNASDISRLVGVAVPSVIYALRKAGIPTKGIGEAKTGRRAKLQRTKGVCVVCNRPAGEINHKDRDHGNNKKSNREIICSIVQKK